jgi:hypothetical protein
MIRMIFSALILMTVARNGYSETFDQWILRWHGVTCDQITQHASGTPKPDCRKIVAAFDRGVRRAVQLWPRAVETRLREIVFYRGPVFWPYGPIGQSEPLLANVPNTPAAYTSVVGSIPFMLYAYEETIEHEVVHYLGFKYAWDVNRELWAVTADDGQWKGWDLNVPMPWWWILCHGTPDDPFGEAGNRRSCLQPYSGEVPERTIPLTVPRQSTPPAPKIVPAVKRPKINLRLGR